MIEILSGTIVWLWEINGDFFEDENEAEEAAQAAGIRLEKANQVQALKQGGHDRSEKDHNFYIIRKVDLSSKEKLRQKALSKLTTLEKKALGLE